MTQFYGKTKICYGPYALETLESFPASHAFVVTDPFMVKSGFADQAVSHLKRKGIEHTLFSGVEPDPSLQAVVEATRLFLGSKADMIIAIGGGSAIDMAKAIAYFGQKADSSRKTTLVAIPTTSGTGSEVTSIAVVTDKVNSVKIPLNDEMLIPDAAILDARFTRTVPPHVTAATGMDVLTHAIEAYTCMAHNPISDAYATAAIKKVSNHLFNVLDNPSDANGRLELAQASTKAGIAFSNSMVGLVHSIGHALGAVAHLPHGLCMNLFLPYVLEFNKEVNGDKIAELLLPLAGPDIYAQTPAHLRADKAISTLLTMRDRLFTLTKLPRTLSETGKVTLEQLDEVAEKALNDGSIIYNPKEASLKDLKAILEKAW